MKRCNRPSRKAARQQVALVNARKRFDYWCNKDDMGAAVKLALAAYDITVLKDRLSTS